MKSPLTSTPATSLLFVGRSHLTCIEEAYKAGQVDADVRCAFVYLHEYAKKDGGPPEPLQRVVGTKVVDNYDVDRIRAIVAASKPDVLCVSIHGNEHFAASVVDLGMSVDDIRARVENKVRKLSFPWLKFVAGLHSRVVLIPPPPPVESDHIRAHPGKMREKLAGQGVSAPQVRIAAWKHQLMLLRSEAAQVGIEVLDLPAEVFSDTGLLRPQFSSDDPSHGNAAFGALVVSQVMARPGRPGKPSVPAPSAPVAAAAAAPRKPDAARSHPYKGLPDAAFWRESVASVPAASLDPVRQVPFGIGKTDKVATAGSCFAQHISKRLRKGGFHFLVTEQATGATEGDAQARGFYDFSARYGNVYTSRQLVQLFDRAFGYFTPVEDHWTLEGGRVCDPFRPRIEPEGFASVEELRADRQRHLQAVRRMFEELDVFVFTLGLTECWYSKLDGAAYPIAPGVSGGEFDAARHAFVNLTVDDITRDLHVFIEKLRLVNPGARIILTVSPVPLAATYSEEHVLVATTYSKSVLRVAAEMTERAHQGVLYFPSYEIITGAYSRGNYFAKDLRSVTDEGVSHVMQVFMNRMIADAAPAAGAPDPNAMLDEIDDLADAVCDEALLARR
ncbi:MAG: hypothetical protein K0S57_1047 [Ramlibacter sp.]|jgi:hypothetical protein|nr:hypothetical protein [Ramlibacter sp.]